MRAALGLVSLLVVLAIVMLNARQSVQPLSASARPGAAVTGEQAGEGGSGSPKRQTEAVREQVQGLVDQSAQRASEAGLP